jgi:hypothetical protein
MIVEGALILLFIAIAKKMHSDAESDAAEDTTEYTRTYRLTHYPNGRVEREEY